MDLTPDATVEASDPRALYARGLVRRFEGVEALRGVDLDVRRGELYGLIGPDGAGKTTTIRLLAGLMAPDAGEARVLGLDPLHGGSRVREALGLMPQQYSLYGDLTIGENLRFFGWLFCIDRARYRARTERLLQITRLAPFVDRRADALSGGMYKKLALACALLHQPEVLLLDEPTNGVDPVSRRELWELLHEFVHDGMTVLVSTPYMDEAERCHRVALIHRGRILAEGDPRALVRDFDHPCFVVEDGDRQRLDEVLTGHPAVRAMSPAGSRLRIVLAPGSQDGVAALLKSHGARLVPAVPVFEDLFLVRLAGEDA